MGDLGWHRINHCHQRSALNNDRKCCGDDDTANVNLDGEIIDTGGQVNITASEPVNFIRL